MNQAMRFEVDAEGVGLLTLDRADKSMNTIDQVFMDELAAVIQRAAADPAIRGVVVTSGKAAFLAGADLFDMEQHLYRTRGMDPAVLFEEIISLSRLLRRLETCGKPFVAAYNGLGLGGGLEFGLACHHRIAADDPRVQLGLPEVQVGLLPAGGGTQRLPRMLGIQKALPYLLEGKQVDARAALEAGIVNAVVPPADLLTAARRWILDTPNAVAPWDAKGFKIPGGAGAFSPVAAQTFLGANSILQEKTWHNMPAPLAILSAVYEGTQLPMEKGLAVEAKYMTRLTLDPVSGNMVRTLFVNKTKADKLVRRPAGIEKQRYAKVGVLGAGLMGGGIAFVAAQAGLEVVLIDRSPEAAAKGKAYAQGRVEGAVKKGRMAPEKAAQILARIHPGVDYTQLAGAEIVIEAVFEDRAIKAEVSRRAEAATGGRAVIASNTSTLPITGLAEAVSRPESFVGLHFFSPVDRMPLVEVIRGKRTSEETLARALDFVQLLRKTPILVNDNRGFFTSRFFGQFVGEGVMMVAEGVKPALVENAARMAGMPVGPLSVSDEVSLKLGLEVSRQTAKDLGPAYKPSASMEVIETLVEGHGRFGRSNGKGFYEYPAGAPKHLWPGLGAIWQPAARQPETAELQDRFIYVQVVDALRCLADGVLTDPADGDVGAVLGVGFPVHLGGPFSFVDMVGSAAFVRRADELAARYGERFEVPPMMRERAVAGRAFYGPASGVPRPT